MSANLKIRTMQTLLIGATLLTPLAAQDRNHNDRNDSRGANHGSYQNPGQRPGGVQAPQATEHRGGTPNFAGGANNNFRGNDRNNGQFRGPVSSAPRNDFRNDNRGERRDFDRDGNRGFERRDFDRDDHRAYDRGYRSNYGARPVNRGYYVSRYPSRHWVTGEDRAFRIWLAERQMAYMSWDAFDPYLQDEYWDWRDSHPDRLLFSIGFGR